MSDSLPTTGYADYRRTDDAAIDVLVDVVGAASTPNPTYGRFFIGQAPSLEISFEGSTQNHDLEITFFHQQIGGPPFGLTAYTVIANSRLRIRVPVYAPWALLQVLPTTATNNGTHSLTVLTSRRIAGSNMPLINTDLLYLSNVSIAANTTRSDFIDQPYTGWAHWHIDSTATSWSALLRATDRNNSILSQITRFAFSAADENINHVFYVPPLILESRIRNSDAAARTFNVALVPVFL